MAKITSPKISKSISKRICRNAFIFDMDGVLVDSEKIHYLAYKQVLQGFGISYSEKHFISLAGKSNKEISIILCKKYSLHVKSEMLRKQKETIVTRMLIKSALFPGVKRKLRELKNKGYKFGLATSSNRRVTRLMRRLHKFDQYFSKYAVADEVTRAKPSPDLFLACAKKLKIKPPDCIVVEDSYYGIIAAKKAGMKCIAITNTLPKIKLRNADCIIERIGQINNQLINKIGGENGRRKNL
jgi:beta-phosphoglucomutase